MLWPDRGTAAPTTAADGGAAALPESAGSADSPGAPVAALSEVYPDPGQQRILRQLAALLDAQSPDPRQLGRFHELMRQLADTEPQAISAEDSGPLTMLDEDAETLAARFAAALDTAAFGLATAQEVSVDADQGGAAVLPDLTLADTDDGTAAAGMGQITGRLWNGAKEALRQFTYWQMKHRAGTVGQHGLGPVLGGGRPATRLLLFARHGGRALYPVASMTSNDDAAGLTDELMFRWGAVGHDGAQAVAAPVVPLRDVSARYSLAASQFTNIDASRIVCHGKPPSGAHSDIVHPELAWAMLTAAGLT